MRLPAYVAMLGLAAVLGICSAGPSDSAEITVLFNQATATGMQALAARYEQTTGQKVNATFLQPGALLYEKVAAGAPGDVVSMLTYEFDDYLKSGRVVAGSMVEYGRVYNGIAVKAGARKPDISTTEAFKRAMLEAGSIGHTMAGTGPYNTRAFQKLGIYDQIKDKIKIVKAGTLVAAAVASGDVEIGIQQANVIQPYPGTEYLGPLPAELTEYGHAGVGVLAASQQQDAARAFIKFTTDPANAALLRKASMEPPER
jgi:molybdate transport system substrate-binding protein